MPTPDVAAYDYTCPGCGVPILRHYFVGIIPTFYCRGCLQQYTPPVETLKRG